MKPKVKGLAKYVLCNEVSFYRGSVLFHIFRCYWSEAYRLFYRVALRGSTVMPGRNTFKGWFGSHAGWSSESRVRVGKTTS